MIDPVSIFTVLSSLIPTGNYVVKRITDYYTGGKTPVNASEQIAERQADAQVLEAINKSDSADGASQWVINIRALQRPLVVYAVLINWTIMTIAGLYGVFIDLQIYVIVANLASSVFFYLFGDRTLMYSLQNLNTKVFGRTK